MTKKPDDVVYAVNLTGGNVNIEEWNSGDKKLAVNVADWLAKRTKNHTAISWTHDGVLVIDYALDGALQPSIRIYSGKIIWPVGTNMGILMEFMTTGGEKK